MIDQQEKCYLSTSESPTVIPHEELLANELHRRVDQIVKRDSINRREALTLAERSLQHELENDLLAPITNRLYRIWFSKSEQGGEYKEAAIWFEGTLYRWPATNRWLCELISSHIDNECKSIGSYILAGADYKRWIKNRQ